MSRDNFFGYCYLNECIKSFDLLKSVKLSANTAPAALVTLIPRERLGGIARCKAQEEILT